MRRCRALAATHRLLAVIIKASDVLVFAAVEGENGAGGGDGVRRGGP
jgi:hypothetical protein